MHRTPYEGLTVPEHIVSANCAALCCACLLLMHQSWCCGTRRQYALHTLLLPTMGTFLQGSLVQYMIARPAFIGESCKVANAAYRAWQMVLGMA